MKRASLFDFELLICLMFAMAYLRVYLAQHSQCLFISYQYFLKQTSIHNSSEKKIKMQMTKPAFN